MTAKGEQDTKRKKDKEKSTQSIQRGTVGRHIETINYPGTVKSTDALYRNLLARVVIARFLFHHQSICTIIHSLYLIPYQETVS